MWDDEATSGLLAIAFSLLEQNLGSCATVLLVEKPQSNDMCNKPVEISVKLLSPKLKRREKKGTWFLLKVNGVRDGRRNEEEINKCELLLLTQGKKERKKGQNEKKEWEKYCSEEIVEEKLLPFICKSHLFFIFFLKMEPFSSNVNIL